MQAAVGTAIMGMFLTGPTPWEACHETCVQKCHCIPNGSDSVSCLLCGYLLEFPVDYAVTPCDDVLQSSVTLQSWWRQGKDNVWWTHGIRGKWHYTYCLSTGHLQSKKAPPPRPCDCLERRTLHSVTAECLDSSSAGRHGCWGGGGRWCWSGEHLVLDVSICLCCLWR